MNLNPIRLSELNEHISDAIDTHLGDSHFWIKAEVADVKKQVQKRWCFLKFVEKTPQGITAEMRAVFWANSYVYIERFEKLTGTPFQDGLELICEVRIRYHARYGLNAEVLSIDTSFAIGALELEKDRTLKKLLEAHPTKIRLIDEQYFTPNNQSSLPLVFKNIALITAQGSDGERDFLQELTLNEYGYRFSVTIFHSTVQGDQAANSMCKQLEAIEKEKHLFDLVVIVRGGGSITDLKAFDDYSLAERVALFPLPIFTGIGHDRNMSITDMMARHLKTPTKVAAEILQRNFDYEWRMQRLWENIQSETKLKLSNYEHKLLSIRRLISSYSPEKVLAKGYALVKRDGLTIDRPEIINPKDSLEIVFDKMSIQVTVEKNE